jgi:putative nucleotidyltransferase with HDIG domain
MRFASQAAATLSGRIMIVSDRPEVVAELEPVLRSAEHLVLAVPDADEALRILGDGVVPDLLITDLASDQSLRTMDYVWRFRGLNRAGRHLVIVEEGAHCFSRPSAGKGFAESITPLRRPFRGDEVRETVSTALLRMDVDIRALRGEMWREMDRLQQTVREVHRDIVRALAATIAARDPYMHGHATRVAALCRRVAVALRLDDADTDLLETAALLHEIGKVSVPVELLLKTEPLSSDELVCIRAHARAGAEIVRQVPALARVAPLIEHQGTEFHELGQFLDPNSVDFELAGVLGVVDAYDAMTHARPYRDALPRAYWQHTLERGVGTRFSGTAVRALLEVLERAEGERAQAA